MLPIMRIPPGVRARLSVLKMPTASLCAIAGLVIAWPEGLLPGNLIPIPDSIASAAAGPIAKLTTIGTVFLLETLGLFIPVSQGALRIGNSVVDLVSASGGLRILIAVMAVSTTAAALASKPLWERVLILLSGLPIGIVCGIFRVFVGCLLFHSAGQWLANLVLFEVAGWLTLAFAWGCLVAERSLLSRLLVPPPAREVVPVLIGSQPATASPRPSARQMNPTVSAHGLAGAASSNHESVLAVATEESPRQRLAFLGAAT
jgi:exosortase/archaeosortase family protein